jgi:hypothetical protein
MRTLISLFLAAVLFSAPTGSMSMTSELDPATGLYRMVITGSQEDVDRVCAQGDCTREFPTRWQATNYYFELFGAANGITLVPLPPPTSG